LSGINYNSLASEQAAGWPSSALPISPITDVQRARFLNACINNAEAKLGGPLQIVGRKATLLERLQHVLKHAREHKVYHRHYEAIWLMERVLRGKHVISSNVTNPVLLGKHHETDFG
jgi:hypothetical protein